MYLRRLRLAVLSVLGLVLSTNATAQPAPGLTVTGVVRNADGTAVAGARATLHRTPANYEALRRRLGTGAPETPLSHDTTGKDGRYRLTVPAPGAYTVEVARPGLLPVATLPMPVTEPVELPPAILTDDAGCRIEVVGATGQPASGVRVEAVTAEGSSPKSMHGGWHPAPRSGRTRADGLLVLPRASGEELELRLSVPPEPLPRTRRAKGAVRWMPELPTTVGRTLRVVDSRGTAVPDVVVTAGRMRWPSGTTDATGELTVAAPESKLPLRLVAPDGRAADVELAPGHEPAVFTLTDAPHRAGSVVDVRGLPVSGALVWHRFDPGVFTLTDGAGHFTLPAQEPGRGWLQAEAPGFLPGLRPDDAAGSYEILLERASTLAGRVVDAAGRGIASAEIVASRLVRAAGSDVFQGEHAVSDPEGRFRLRRLDPGGGYALRAWRTGFVPAERIVGHLGNRRDGVELVLLPGGPVFGRVVDLEERPLAGVEVRLRPLGDHRRIAGDIVVETAGDGRFRSSEVPAPRFDLLARKSGFAPLRVRGVEMGTAGIRPSTAPHDLGTLVLEPAAAIRGVVTDPEGLAVVGAAVWIRSDLDRSGWDFVHRVEKVPADAETGVDGRFELGELPPGERFHLVVRHPEYLPRAVEAVEAPTAEPLRVVLDPGLRISGWVSRPDGEPVPGADVVLSAAGSLIGATELPLLGQEHERATRSGDDGRFTISGVAAGELRLRASARGLLPSEPLLLDTRTAGELTGLRLTLAPGAALEGRVTTGDGEPVSGARIHASPAVGFSDGDGTYRLDGVAPGKVEVEVRHPVYRRTTREVELRDGVRHLDLVLPRGRPLTGRVVTPDGRGVADARVTLQAEEPRDYRRAHAFTDADGAFRFDEVARGRYLLEAHKRGYAVAEERLEVDDRSAALEVTLLPEVTLTGRVTGLDFDELASLEIEASHETRRPRQAEVDFEGHYTVAGLAPGDWKLHAFTRDRRRQVEASVVLAPGRLRVERDLVFGLGHTLSGQVVWNGEPLEGARITVRGREVSASPETLTRHDGRFEVADLSPGAYRVALSHPRKLVIDNRDVVLDGDLELLFEIDTSTVSGYVVDDAHVPISDAAVLLRQLYGAEDDSLFLSPTNAEGFFGFPRIPSGTYRLQVDKDGFSVVERRLEVPGESAEPLLLELEPTAGLKLWVRRATGETPPYVSAAVLDGEGRLVLKESRPTDADGRAVFPSVPPGSWRVLVQGPGSAAVEAEVSVPGEAPSLVLPAASRLHLRVASLLESGAVASAVLFGADGRPFQALDAYGAPRQRWQVVSGLATIDAVPAGAWTVRVESEAGEVGTGAFVVTGEPEFVVEVP